MRAVRRPGDAVQGTAMTPQQPGAGATAVAELQQVRPGLARVPLAALFEARDIIWEDPA